MKRDLAIALITAVVLAAIALLAWRVHHDVRTEVLEQASARYALIARHLAKEVEASLAEHAGWAQALAAFPEVRSGEPRGIPTDLLEQLHGSSRSDVTAVTVCDAHGTVVYATQPDAVGKPCPIPGSGAANGVATAPSRAVVSLAAPLLDLPARDRGLDVRVTVPLLPRPQTGVSAGGTLPGMLILTVDVGAVLTRQLAAFQSQFNIDRVWVVDRKGALLFHPEHPEMVARNPDGRDAQCSGCHATFDYLGEMVARGEGAARYRLRGEPERLVAFAPLRLNGLAWTVAVSTPFQRLTALAAGSLRDTLLLLAAMALSLVGATSMLRGSYRRRVAAEVETAHWREKRALEDQVRESEARFRSLFNGVPVGLYLSTPEGRVVDANPALLEMLGYPDREAFLAVNAADLYVDPKSRKHWQDLLARDGVVEGFEERLNRRDGAIIWVSDSGRGVRDEGGNVRYYQGTMTDITERKLAQEQLQQHFERLRLIYKLSDAVSHAAAGEEIYDIALAGLQQTLKADRVAILLVDPDGVARFKSWRGLSDTYRRAVEGHWPWQPGDVDPQPVLIEDAAAREDLGSLREVVLVEGVRALAFIPIVSQGRPFGKFMVYFDVPHVFSEDELRVAGTIARHVAFALERRLAEASLRESEERYRTIVERSNDLIWTLDAAGNFTFFNRRAEEMSGYRFADWRGRSFAPLIVPPEDLPRVTEIFRATLAGRPQQYEVGVRRADGGVFYLLVNTVPIVKDDAVIGTVSFGRDVTEQRRAETALAESESRYRQQAEDLALLFEASQLFTSSLNLKAALHQVSKRCVEALDVDTALVRLVEDGQLVVKGHYYRDEADKEEIERLLRQHPLRVGYGIAGRVAQTGEPLMSGVAPLDSLTLPGYVPYLKDRAWLVVPMKIEERTIGVLTFMASERNRVFSQRDLALAQGIANEAAIAIENARLFEEVNRELGERRRAEANLRETQDFLEHLLDNASAPIIVWDPSSRITRFNYAFERLTGYGADEVLGRELGMLFPPARRDEELSKIARTLEGEQWESVEIPILCKDGALRFALWNSANVYTDDGRMLRATVAQGVDITEHKRLEEQLRHAQKMEAVGRLAGGVAHDFNNLLQALLSVTYVLQSRRDDPARFSATIEELTTHVQRGAALARQLLLFARRQVVRLQHLDLNEVVAGASTLLRRLVRENVHFELDTVRAALPVSADQRQLEQVLVNLVLNACDAMPDGGTVRVRTSGEEGEVWFEVTDTGSGIPEELHEKIFEPFFTTKPVGQGTGLGLSVVHGIVTQHGGRVCLTSQTGEGSTFRVVLPRAGELASDSTRVVSATGDDPPTGHGERVLVVEDEEGAREGLREILGMLGYQTTAVGSGEEAEAIAAQPGFDILLTDLLLPGVQGGELAERLRARWPALKVAFMSGYAPEDVIRPDMSAANFRFLQKPFDIGTLARELWGLLH